MDLKMAKAGGKIKDWGCKIGKMYDGRQIFARMVRDIPKIYLNFATSSSRTGGSTDGRLGEQMKTWVEDFTGATTRPKKRKEATKRYL